MVSYCDIEQYLRDVASRHSLIDVRSPGEYARGHIPGSFNIPLFSDEERAHVGTVYKEVGPSEAFDIGMTYVKPKLNWFIQQAIQTNSKEQTITIHCWRGGQRSAAFAKHLSAHGFKNVQVIEGGYKAYRQHLLKNLSELRSLLVLGGYTGSGKTDILKELAKSGEQVIDLEELARHKGSAFGAIDNTAQPTSEQFANDLFEQLSAMDKKRRIWVEDESVAIGQVRIPHEFFVCMKEAPTLFINIGREQRALHLVDDYKDRANQNLIKGVEGITRKLGGQNAKEAIAHINHGNYRLAAEICLYYYDRLYEKGIKDRTSQVHNIELTDTDASRNASILLNYCKNLSNEKRRSQTYPI